MSCNELKILDAGALKIIAYVSMVCDHANKAVILPYLEVHNAYSATWNTVTTVLSVIGTFAFPIFCFLIVESCFKTSNKKKFLGLLAISAVISEIPFDLATYNVLYEPGHQNIFFELLLIVCMVLFNEYIRGKTHKRVIFIISVVATTIAGALISDFAAFDFGFYGILIGIIFYLGHIAYDIKNNLPSKVVPSIVAYAVMLKEWYIFPTFLILMTYNGKRGRQSKILNYVFYPAHLMVLWLIFKIIV